MRLRVDHRDRSLVGVGDPHEACGDRDAGRPGAYRDPLLHLEGRRIDLEQPAAPLIGHPERPGARSESPRELTDVHGAFEVPRCAEEPDRTRCDRRLGIVGEQDDRGADRDREGDRGRDQDPRARTATRPAGRRQCRPQALSRIDTLRNDPNHLDRVGQVLQLHLPPVDIADALDPACEVRDAAAREDLARARLPAQPSREIERTASVPALEGNSLAGVQPDAGRHRKLGVVDGLIHEPFLEIDRCCDGLPGGGEHRERLVPPEFDHAAAARLDRLARDPGELGGELRGRLVTALLREEGIAADVGDQEGLDPSLCGHRLDAASLLVHHAPTANGRARSVSGPFLGSQPGIVMGTTYEPAGEATCLVPAGPGVDARQDPT